MIIINGDNNRVKWSQYSFKVQQLLVEINGNNNIVEINRLRRVGRIKLVVQNSGYLSIGEKTSIEHAYIFCEGSSISIGNDCMILSNVTIRNSDLHGIYCSKSGILKNKLGDILINNHVWIGNNSIIYQNTEIGSNSVVSDGCIVKDILVDEKVVLQGGTAQVVDTGVIWDRRVTENLFADDADFDPFLKDCFDF